MDIMSNKILIKVENLKKYYPIRGNIFKKSRNKIYAINNINLEIYKGEILGLVGESGCGKTTLGRLLLRLLEPTDGKIYYNNIDINKISQEKLRKLRKNIQIVFQNPYDSLHPRKTVGQIIEEPLIIHRLGNSETRKNKILDILNVVGLLPEHIGAYPHEFSGGQRQRIGVARALVINPNFIVCDEPVSALDVSIQAQILNLLKKLQKKFSLTYLFIAHNFSVVRFISDRIAVMYLGKIVEISTGESLYENPAHPYTKALISAIPIPDPIKTKNKKRILLRGDVPSPVNLPSGCIFHKRCPFVEKICTYKEPKLMNYGKNSEHRVACHFTRKFINYD